MRSWRPGHEPHMRINCACIGVGESGRASTCVPRRCRCGAQHRLSVEFSTGGASGQRLGDTALPVVHPHLPMLCMAAFGSRAWRPTSRRDRCLEVAGGSRHSHRHDTLFGEALVVLASSFRQRSGASHVSAYTCGVVFVCCLFSHASFVVAHRMQHASSILAQLVVSSSLS